MIIILVLNSEQKLLSFQERFGRVHRSGGFQANQGITASLRSQNCRRAACDPNWREEAAGDWVGLLGLVRGLREHPRLVEKLMVVSALLFRDFLKGFGVDLLVRSRIPEPTFK